MSEYCQICTIPDKSNFSLEILSNVEDLTFEIIHQFCNPDNNPKLDLFKKLCTLINLNPFIIDMNFEALNLLFDFLLNDSAEYLVITENNKNYTQSKQKIKFCELLKQSVQDDCHTVPGDTKCPSGYTCSFHAETIRTHLLLAMLYTLFYLPESMDQKEKFKHITTALFHDIAKNPTVTLIAKKDKPGFIGYPIHGLQGSLLMAQLWSSSLDRFFTKEEWEDLCNTILYHMCGYHHIDDINAPKRLNLLKNVCNQNVKNGLFRLSFGDNFGKVAHDKIQSKEQDVDRSIRFCQGIQGESNIEKIIEDNSLHQKSIFINIIGRSGSGKSTIINQLKETLKTNNVREADIIIISRDKLTCDVVKEHLSENESKTDLEQILLEQLNDINPEILPDKEVRKGVQDYYVKLNDQIKNKNKQNPKTKIESLAERVNNKCKRLIDEAISSNKIIFFDTLALVYMYTASQMLPESVKKCLRIMIFIARNEELDQAVADRLGIDIQKQLELHNCKDITKNILPPGSERNYDNLKAINELTKYESENFNPIYQFYYTWNASNSMGDISVNNFFTKLGKFFSGTTLVEHVDTSNSTNIVDLVNKIYSETSSDADKIGVLEDYFVQRLFYFRKPLKGTEYENKVIFIVYRDGINKEWSLWGRQCRGVILALIDNKWVCIKRLLQRGPEVFTGYHIDTGTDQTQDTSSRSTDQLNIKHQQVIDKLLKYNSDKCFLSMKKDGSLVGVHIYLFESVIGKFMKDVIEKYDNDFAKFNLQTCITLDLPFFILISTSGTLMIGDNMLSTVVTSIIDGYFKEDGFYERINITKISPFDTFKTYSERFIIKINEFYMLLNPEFKEINTSIFLSFEAITKNVKDAWGKEHRELATGYEKSSFTFLGVTVNVGETPGLYLPHFSVNSSMFVVPLYWETTLNLVTPMIIELSKVITGKMSEIEYMRKFKPSNPDYLLPDDKVNDIYVIDPEGFILYTVDPDIEIKELLYSKVKTPEYYIAHKLDLTKVREILELDEQFIKSFPHVKRMKQFINKMNVILLYLNNKYKLFLNSILFDESFLSKLDPKESGFFRSERAPKEGKLKALLNKKEFQDSLFEIIKTVFPDTNVEKKDDVISNIKKILIDTKFWLDDNTELVNNLSRNYSDEKIMNLYNLTFGVINDNYASLVGGSNEYYKQKYLKYKKKYLEYKNTF
jgi:energy-coupling factor transporter ATP-binding protein EcfA2